MIFSYCLKCSFLLLLLFLRERAAEAERDIERQRTLEIERAKTRELRHTLDVEAERRAQV